MGCKILKRLFDPDHAPFREDFSSAGWDVLWFGCLAVLVELRLVTDTDRQTQAHG